MYYLKLYGRLKGTDYDIDDCSPIYDSDYQGLDDYQKDDQSYDYRTEDTPVF